MPWLLSPSSLNQVPANRDTQLSAAVQSSEKHHCCKIGIRRTPAGLQRARIFWITAPLSSVLDCRVCMYLLDIQKRTPNDPAPTPLRVFQDSPCLYLGSHLNARTPHHPQKSQKSSWPFHWIVFTSAPLIESVCSASIRHGGEAIGVDHRRAWLHWPLLGAPHAPEQPGL